MNKNFDLIKGLKSGDNRAYEYLFDHYYPILCQIAYEFVQDDFLAQTMVGDVFFNLWEKREVIQIDRSIQGYLIRSVKNACINYLNSNAQKKEYSCNQEFRDILFETIADETVTPLENLTSQELESKVTSLLSSLSKETRNVFILSRFHDKSYDVISKELGISINTVKYHMKKALSFFQSNLQDYLKILLLFMFK